MGLFEILAKNFPIDEAKKIYNSLLGQFDDAVAKGKMPQYTADDVIAGKIPIDPASHTSRRIEQGFKGEPKFRGQIGDDYRDQTWWSSDKDLANTYANTKAGGSVKSAYIKEGDTATVYPDTDQWNRIGTESYIKPSDTGEYRGLFEYITGKTPNEFDVTNTNKLAEWSKYADLDTLNIKGLRDVGPYNTADLPWDLKRSDVTIVNKPENIREIGAIFDPRNVGKNYPLGAIGAGAVGLGMLASSDKSLADPVSDLRTTEAQWDMTPEERAIADLRASEEGFVPASNPQWESVPMEGLASTLGALKGNKNYQNFENIAPFGTGLVDYGYNVATGSEQGLLDYIFAGGDLAVLPAPLKKAAKGLIGMFK